MKSATRDSAHTDKNHHYLRKKLQLSQMSLIHTFAMLMLTQMCVCQAQLGQQDINGLLLDYKICYEMLKIITKHN